MSTYSGFHTGFFLGGGESLGRREGATRLFDHTHFY